MDFFAKLRKKDVRNIPGGKFCENKDGAGSNTASLFAVTLQPETGKKIFGYGKSEYQQDSGEAAADRRLPAAGAVVPPRVCRRERRVLDARTDRDAVAHLPRRPGGDCGRRQDCGLRAFHHRGLRLGEGRPHVCQGHGARNLQHP